MVGIRLAVACLGLTALLGLALALLRAGWWAPPALESTAAAHLAFGLLGWVLLLVIGVAYQVVPMFQITPPYPPRLARWLAGSLFALLLAQAFAPLLPPAVALLVDAALAGGILLHFDLTSSRAFSPSPELARLARELQQDVELTYFFHKQDPAAQAIKALLGVLARESPRLHVRAVDPDQFPGVANRYGVRTYNVAVLEAGGRRIQVQTTSDQELALGIVRVTRSEARTVCFATGHAEYDIDNFEYHTHFEGARSHGHGAEGARVVLMEQHGFGRVRRALESLGIATRKVPLATAGRVPPECTALVEAGPRTRHAPQEVLDVTVDPLTRDVYVTNNRLGRSERFPGGGIVP